MSFYITHTATESDFTFSLSPRIELNPNKKYEAALLSVNLYNSIPNITESNNKFKYHNGKSWKTITLNKGSYEIEAINTEIQRQMIINGDCDTINEKFYITLSADITELKSVINITNESYKVALDEDHSIGPILGFNPSTLDHGYNKSHNNVDITRVNLVLVNVDFIKGSYVNGKELPTIYSFDPYKVPPGYKLDDRPNPSLTYYPLNGQDKLNKIRIWLTDQNSEAIDLRGEKVTIKIQIREVVNIKELIKEAIKELKEENIL